ncbi:MAG: sensor histidine kinase [Myxococcaceae bacterium]
MGTGSSKSSLLRYLAPVVAAPLSVAATRVLQPWLDGSVSMIPLAVVFLCALFLGGRSGLVAAGLCIVGLKLAVLPDPLGFPLSVDLRLGLFAALSLLLVWVASSRRLVLRVAQRARDEAEQAQGQAEHDTREAEEARRFLTSVVENIPAMVFIKEAGELRFVRINRASEQLLGWPREQLLGKRDRDFFPEEAERYEAADRAVLGRGVPLDIPDEPLHTRDKGLRRLHTIKVPLRDEQGRPQYLLAIALDITEQKRAEADRERLLTQELEYRRAAEAARTQAELTASRLREVLAITEIALGKLELPDLLRDVAAKVRAVFAVDTVSILLLSEDGSELELRAGFGMEEADAGLAGRTLQERRAVIVEDIDTVQLASPVLRDLGVRSLVEVPMRLEGQAIGMLQVGSLTPRAFTGNEATLLQLIADRLAIAADRARSFAREREQRQQAQQAVRARDELLAVVSHDLRNPLNAISLGASVLQSKLSSHGESARMRHHADTIKRAADRMTRLIADLLDAAKIEAKGLSIERGPVDAVALLTEITDSLRAAADQKSLLLEQRIAKGLPQALCDRARVMQVLSNLIGNAIKFTPEGGEVLVCAGANGGEILYSVSDTGPGLAQEELLHLFERYWQAQRTARQGSGLGLYIAKGIVEAHGGRMWAESRPGQGSRFFFTLPAVSRMEDQPAA